MVDKGVVRMSKRDIVIFLAGAEFFHTIFRIVMPHVINFPIVLPFVVVTETMNNYAIGVNAVITILLLWYARRLKDKKGKR
jgi:hypothetical protein